jgi:hypothetical protein
VFDLLLAKIRALGFIKTRGKQRTDSIAVLGAVTQLSVLELAWESLRLAVRALGEANPGWSAQVLPASFREDYGQRRPDYRLSAAERAALQPMPTCRVKARTLPTPAPGEGLAVRGRHADRTGELGHRVLITYRNPAPKCTADGNAKSLSAVHFGASHACLPLGASICHGLAGVDMARCAPHTPTLAGPTFRLISVLRNVRHRRRSKDQDLRHRRKPRARLVAAPRRAHIVSKVENAFVCKSPVRPASDLVTLA